MVAPFFLQSNKLSPDRLTNLPKDTQQVASRHRLWAKAIWVWVCTVNHQARPYEHGEHPSFSFICVMLVVNATPDTSQGLHIYPISRYDWIRTSPGTALPFQDALWNCILSSWFPVFLISFFPHVPYPILGIQTIWLKQMINVGRIILSHFL